MPEFNEQLARNALKRIKENPQEWNQADWRCKTGMCFAGFVAMEAGAVWASSDTDDPHVVTPSGEVTTSEEYASEQLGIEYGFSYIRDIFRPYNTVEDLECMIDKLSK